MGQSPDSSSYNQENDGLPFFQGNADFGDIYPVTRMWCNKPTKIANKGELLLSIRAPIGALNFATEECCIGRGLAAISPVNENVNIKYIYYALKHKNQELNNKGTGSTFKAINKGSLSEVKIPNIDVSEQNNCVEKLDRVIKIIKYRKRQLEDLDNLIKSRFVEMFGDPVSNSKGLAEYTSSEIGEFGRGVSKHRPRNAPELLGGKYPLIQTGDVANTGLYITNYESTYSELGYKQSKMWNKGTLCITIAANIITKGEKNKCQRYLHLVKSKMKIFLKKCMKIY